MFFIAWTFVICWMHLCNIVSLVSATSEFDLVSGGLFHINSPWIVKTPLRNRGMVMQIITISLFSYKTSLGSIWSTGCLEMYGNFERMMDGRTRSFFCPHNYINGGQKSCLNRILASEIRLVNSYILFGGITEIIRLPRTGLNVTESHTKVSLLCYRASWPVLSFLS